MHAARFGDSRYWVSGYPRLVSEWDSESNGSLTPDEVPAGSARRIQWRCSKGPDHVWVASANNRTASRRGGTGCPYCANRKPSVTNCLAAVAPRIAAEWDAAKNGALTPRDVVATSTRICFWRCTEQPNHVWKASVRDRTRDRTGCPFCANRRTSGDNSLAATHPRVAAEWHPTFNAPLTPSDVRAGSSLRAWWRCAVDPEHEWRATISNRVRRASGCPFCPARRAPSPDGTHVGSTGDEPTPESR